MATFILTKEGSWRAQVRRKGKYASRTFRLKGAAQQWAREVEHVIDQGGEVTTACFTNSRTEISVISGHGFQ